MKLTAVNKSSRGGPCAAFTLVETLVALTFLAIIIPVAVQALHVASLAGQVAARKSEASRVADKVLNQSLIMTNWNSGSQSGTITEGADDFKWTLSSSAWPQGAGMQLLTAVVTFSGQGRDFSVSLSTLANSQTQAATMNSAPGTTSTP